MSGDQANASGAGGSNTGTGTAGTVTTGTTDSGNGIGEQVPPKPKTVAWDDHQRALTDLHKFKGQVQELQDHKSNSETQSLKDKEDWQKLAALKEEEANGYKSKFEGLQDSLVKEKKFSALKDAALQSGIRKEALQDLDMVDMEGLAIETTNMGRMQVHGADSLVQKLKQDRPHWFGGRVPNINVDSPEVINNGGGGEITYAMITKLEEKARATGDSAAYHKALKQFKLQNA